MTPAAAAAVTDAHAGDFSGEFWLDAETRRFEFNLLVDLAGEDFVTDFHVGEVEVGEHVGEHGEDVVGHLVPEIHNAVGLADEAASEDGIGLTVEDRLEEFGVVGRESDVDGWGLSCCNCLVKR